MRRIPGLQHGLGRDHLERKGSPYRSPVTFGARSAVRTTRGRESELQLITWICPGNRYPYFKAERNQFLALDDDVVVGMVRLSSRAQRAAAGSGR